MTLARDLMAAVWDRKPHPADGDMPATRPPAASDAPSRPEPIPGTHPPHHEPVQATSDAERTDRFSGGWVLDHEHDARWHADEAHRLAKLAELTKDRSPWAAAHDMTWRP